MSWSNDPDMAAFRADAAASDAHLDRLADAMVQDLMEQTGRDWAKMTVMAALITERSEDLRARLRPQHTSVIPAREYEIGYDSEREMQDWLRELRG